MEKYGKFNIDESKDKCNNCSLTCVLGIEYNKMDDIVRKEKLRNLVKDRPMILN